MQHHISAITFLVDNYDSAIAYFTQTLNFSLTEDRDKGEGSRFVLVTPKGSATSLLLAKAKSDEDKAMIGKQAGGKVFMILHTDDFWRDHQSMCDKGVEFLETPREEAYGTVAIFKDCFGNKWDLLQPAPANLN
ncbi:glyoxalase [Alteromonas sp. KS69]|jgi:predicted enzyme related to lactoylglutathione lyase|uniref:Glyoxalase/bleomycin resistance protein/dioxygenase n=1 Tax=Alteromonas naphthalenivorans TaxID=715451 RepID=F5ZEV7_ALTNA|nr:MULTISPECIES: VOC family protein [Alteromonas]AEF04657.1 Glyoxalase/bleomycin resistance protein/dioxygenase [Alteromonas naphthalenivorans]PHS55550.1 MAG: glyoxalase [Alteromonas sp.]RUP79545.1 glyoxalase [Alteromonas sp. KS69]|tara:strand:+ start:1674 stop:2075 length:402 start_codon:yes stop_codon:yes gene_type:complete